VVGQEFRANTDLTTELEIRVASLRGSSLFHTFGNGERHRLFLNSQLLLESRGEGYLMDPCTDYAANQPLWGQTHTTPRVQDFKPLIVAAEEAKDTATRRTAPGLTSWAESCTPLYGLTLVFVQVLVSDTCQARRKEKTTDRLTCHKSRATSFWNSRAQTLWQASCNPQGAVGATEKSFSAESHKRTEQEQLACFPLPPPFDRGLGLRRTTPQAPGISWTGKE
jgi:hypothetical protein